MKAEHSPWQRFHDLEAPIYDELCYTQNTDQELEFMIDLLNLAPGASILDLGCGTGRHAVGLARKGFSVTGIDLSSGMLAQARAKAGAANVEIDLIQADAARFSLDRQFDVVICICEGSFGLLGSEDDANDQPLAILRNVSRSLKPGGKTLFTLLSAFKMIRERSQDDVDQGRFDPLTMTTSTEHSPREGLPPIRLRVRAFTPTEVTLLFQLAGLSVLNIWGGTAGNWGQRAIDLDEFEIMVVAQKPVQ
jgi:ubiquinone/menaquinone biosynthesis C-methylase UbiE